MRTLLYVLDDNVTPGIRLHFARRDETIMTEHFGSSLVTVRLIAYLRERSTSPSVAARNANAEGRRRSRRFQRWLGRAVILTGAR
jgi:hypothetical protein